MLWYATAGHHPGDADDHRARAPGNRTKAEPSTADMIAKQRRVLPPSTHSERTARNSGCTRFVAEPHLDVPDAEPGEE